MVKQTIQIFGRIKPTNKTAASNVYSVNHEEETGGSLEFLVPRDLADGIVNHKRENYKFRFRKVFEQHIKQDVIFEDIAKPVAESVLAGYNGTIFAYGQTGSGKTFTITGGAERYVDRGIIPRTLSYLYERFNQEGSMMYTMHISYLEIYNEVGYDLLDSRYEASRLEDLPKVMILEDTEQNIHLKNLSVRQSGNEEEALNLLFLGDTNRMIAETPMNQASTRSHCVFTIHLCRREPGSATLRRSKLHLVDLAGSDRVSKTGLDGQLLTEAKYINLSLHYLEQVIIALSEKNRSHIPYRNSMLTSVLRDSLGGNCMTTMIATMAVDKRNLDESISTCRFAQRVALIKNEAILNEELDPALLIARLRREIQFLNEELAIVTGEQRQEQLTAEEIQKLDELVKAFLNDPDPDVTLSLGPDMRKIQHCFFLMKRLLFPIKILNFLLHSTNLVEMVEKPRKETELTKLNEMLKQRDNEISILVRILKKEKKLWRKRIHKASLEKKFQRDIQPSRSGSRDKIKRVRILKTIPFTGFDIAVLEKREQLLMKLDAMQRCSKLSMGKQEAFEIFIRDHEEHQTIEENSNILKERSDEARRLGEQLKGARNRITVTGNDMQDGEENDPLEESLCKQIKQEKVTYNSNLGRLKALRTEIEHLQLLMDRVKVKIQKDFLKWWSQEALNLQVTGLFSSHRAFCKCVHTRGLFMLCHNKTTNNWRIQPQASAYVHNVCEVNGKDKLPAPVWSAWNKSQEESKNSYWRDLSTTTLTSSSIPLTGDQEVDSDILAFVIARKNLLSRIGCVGQN
uniref:Kinesin family member 6 n=1 Tax=Poecilia formosa TaxID=48698 RepID=A0A087XRW3_POEFO